MTTARKRRSALAITLGLVGLNLIALLTLTSRWSTVRLDLTRGHVYSITPATERIIASLEEELTIYGYFSNKTHPKLAPLVPEIKDMLDEYRAVSGGRIHIEIIDPGEDETAEEEANDRYGVRSTPFRLASKYESGIVNAYFALVVKYADQYVRYGFEDIIRIDPLPDGDIDVRLRNLEYDLTRAIKKTAYGFRTSAELFERVEKPVRFTAIMSPDQLPEVFSKVPDAVRKAVEELEENGGERFEYEEIDPSGDQALADRVFRQYGARPMSVGLFGDSPFYLYGILESDQGLEQIQLTQESLTAAGIRESIENSLRRQTPGFLKTVGLVAAGPDIPPEVARQLQMRGQQTPPPEFEQIRLFLQQDYKVDNVNMESASGVPSDIDVLLLVEPRNLGDRAVYNLDQYLMRGGRVVLCIGNYKVRFDASGIGVTPQTTGLDDWLGNLGIEVEHELVLDDRNLPLPVPQVRRTVLGLIRTYSLTPYPYLVAVREDGLITPEVTGDLDALGIYWGSPIALQADSLDDIEVFELLRSSKKSWTSTDLTGVSTVNYTVPEEGNEPQLLAVALSGKFESYFTERQAPGFDTAADDEDPAPRPTPITLSPETRLTVIGSSAFLSDLIARVLTQPDGGAFGENLRFVQNLIDWSVLDNDLVGIRSRAVSAPRLERLESGTEMAIEAVNYIAPLLLLLSFGALRFLKRKKTGPRLDGESATSLAGRSEV